ncbi:MAG: PAC2 family protein [Acidimicrobiales bacterium]
MTDLQWTERAELTRPVLIAAFEGLFDVGEAATSAVRHLADRWPTHPVARIDPETFFDFTQQRPTVQMEGGVRTIAWPENECVAVRPSVAGAGAHDLVLLAGIEPHLRWTSFCRHLATVASELAVEMVVTLGAAPGRQPHNRPFQITSSCTNADLARRLGVGRPSYQGPTGVVGVLHDTLHRLDIPVLSVRTAVPPYVMGSPNPKARSALLRHLSTILAIDTGHDASHAEVAAWEEQVDEALAADPEALGFVRQLEEDFDASSPAVTDELTVVDGDDLAAEVEAFLREQQGD